MHLSEEKVSRKERGYETITHAKIKCPILCNCLSLILIKTHSEHPDVNIYICLEFQVVFLEINLEKEKKSYFIA